MSKTTFDFEPTNADSGAGRARRVGGEIEMKSQPVSWTRRSFFRQVHDLLYSASYPENALEVVVSFMRTDDDVDYDAIEVAQIVNNSSASSWEGLYLWCTEDEEDFVHQLRRECHEAGAERHPEWGLEEF